MSARNTLTAKGISMPATTAKTVDQTCATAGVVDTAAPEPAKPASEYPVDSSSDTEGIENPSGQPARSRPRRSWARVLTFAVLPALVLLLGSVTAYMKWLDGTNAATQLARIESVQAANDSTVVLLSYQPETVEKNLTAARDRLTGAFLDAYTKLVNEVVIPGAKQKHISAVATVPAAASVSASQNHAVVLVFVDQTTTIGNDAPTSTTSSVKVTLDRISGRWLISDFTPV